MTTKIYDIVGLGVCTLDLLMRVDELPCGEGVQRTEESRLQGGGPVSTALAAASVLGARTALIDRLGDDWRGRLIEEELESWGVDISRTAWAPGESSCLASVWVRRRDGARCIAFAGGSAPELSPEELPADLVESARILHTNGRHEAAMIAAARLARRAGTRVSFDGGANRFRDAMRDFLPLVDIAIVAKEWADRFAGSGRVDEAAAAIRASGPGLVVITDGLEGSWVFSADEEPFHQVAFRMAETVDTTGCGDVYHGAFLTGLAREWPLWDCARVASAAAALNSCGLGGRGNLADMEEIRGFLEKRA